MICSSSLRLQTASSLLGCLLCLLCLQAKAALRRAGLQEAIGQGLVSISARASGYSYMGKGLHLEVRNNTTQPLQLTVEPGLIFRPEDTVFQDLVLCGDTRIVLARNGATSLDVQSFCGKSSARAPATGLSFALQGRGDSALVRVLQFIGKYGLYDQLGQHAVWVLTDRKELSSLYDPERPDLSMKLLALLLQLTGRPAPAYYKHYRLNTRAGEPVLEERVLKIYSVLEWQLPAPEELTLGIYNDQNRLVQSVLYKKEYARGRYRLTVTFESRDMPPGPYFIRLRNTARILKEQQVMLD